MKLKMINVHFFSFIFSPCMFTNFTYLTNFIVPILIDCFSVFVKCFYKYMVHELVR